MMLMNYSIKLDEIASPYDAHVSSRFIRVYMHSRRDLLRNAYKSRRDLCGSPGIFAAVALDKLRVL
jgi:hypothetical protein